MPLRGIFSRVGGALLLLIAVFAYPGEGEAKPQRIVSLNVCTDQLLMQLAEPENIRSLSFLARDPDNSAMAEDAKRYPVNYGSAEEIIRLDPDLVLAGEFTTQPTLFLLRKLGYTVLELPLAHNLDDIRRNIKRLARAIGETEQGARLIERFDAALPPRAKHPLAQDAPVAALYWANGLTSGDDTLAGAIVHAAGFRNLAGELEIPGNGQIPIELLIRAAPDIVITGAGGDNPSLATEKMRHPALQKAFRGKLHNDISSTAWVCGTPLVANAIASLYEFQRTNFQPRGAQVEKQ